MTAQQLFVTHIAKRKIDRAVLFVPGGLPGFFLQIAKQLCGVFAKCCLRRAVTQLPDDPCGVPCGAGCDLAPLQQHSGHAAVRQMIQG